MRTVTMGVNVLKYIVEPEFEIRYFIYCKIWYCKHFAIFNPVFSVHLVCINNHAVFNAMHSAANFDCIKVNSVMLQQNDF